MKLLTAEKLKEIVELTNTVPPEYRQKCFDLLLSYALKSLTPPPPPPPPPPPGGPFILPIDVKAFLSQYGLDEAKLWKLYFIDGGEIRPIYQLTETKKSRVQIQHALLMALESALLTGQFQVGIEALRTRCNEQKCYDKINFMTNLKTYKGLFKAVEKDQPLVLSPEGKSELSDIIEQLIA
jgi:hypothetical protein